MRRRTLIGFGALLALGIMQVVDILIGVVIGRASSVEILVGEVTIEQQVSLPTVTVWVSGIKGQRSPTHRNNRALEDGPEEH